MTIMNETASLHVLTSKTMPKQAWMTNSLIKHCNIKINIYKLAKNGKIEWSTYTSFRNKLIRLIRIQKQNYY